MTKAWALAGLALLAAAAAPRAALAARAATVDAEDIELHEGPGRRFKVLDKLPKGTALAASNQPIEGYYKVRLSSGLVGFVAADALILGAPPAIDEAQPAREAPEPGPLPRGQAAAPPPNDAAANEPDFRQRPQKQHFRAKAFGGYNLFSVKDVNDLVQADVLRFGYSGGAEFDYLFTPDLAMVVRFERVFKGVFARDVKTLEVFDLDVSSYPLMTGVELTLTSGKKVATHFTLMGGLALQTRLAAEDQNAAVPNVTEMSSHAFTGVAKLDFAFLLNKSWSVFGEAGYRYLKTVELIPALAVNGSGIFQDPATGQFVPLSIDLGGPFVAAGVGYTF